MSDDSTWLVVGLGNPWVPGRRAIVKEVMPRMPTPDVRSPCGYLSCWATDLNPQRCNGPVSADRSGGLLASADRRTDAHKPDPETLLLG
jgi:hypothetical protein